MQAKSVEQATEHFGQLVNAQLARIERIKKEADWIDYQALDQIVIGVLGGDGIGPAISHEAQRILEDLLSDQVSSGKVVFRTIDGLTIERRAEERAAIPAAVLEEIRECHVTLKGPTTTPEQGDAWPNIESANVAMRKELDLFANVRPVRVPAEGIDWTFFRENTEDLYAVGSQGVTIGDLAVDFKMITKPGSDRIIRAAFDFAKKNGKDRLTIVTKANVVKTTDGTFLDTAREVAKDYPGIEWEGWYIDIMTAKLVDPKRRRDFQVLALPNLYGDILTDEAAEFQGGVGTAGSANIGKRYAMFEAIHGSAPRMVREGRAQYADPSSMVRAGAMMLSHIGYRELGERLGKALDLCGQYEAKLKMTGRDTGATSRLFGDYILETVRAPDLESRWDAAVRAAAGG
ncbi:MAG: isocitrate/isopropylmalate family dehydrogenase [Chloroflexi bacterium]|nr:isocitrate/isopropylmalate family dehydrogenase [Chloroflexota bacterium]